MITIKRHTYIYIYIHCVHINKYGEHNDPYQARRENPNKIANACVQQGKWTGMCWQTSCNGKPGPLAVGLDAPVTFWVRVGERCLLYV